jgi:ABC-2 type transport system permease protein
MSDQGDARVFDRGARIIDRGYRPYDGPRGVTGAAMRACMVHSIQRTLGLKRQFRHKLLPLVTVLFAFLPAIVFIGLVAFIPADVRREGLLPSYAEYYGYVSAAIFLFTAFVAPEVLCTDRRTGMLGLYFSSPLDRTTYLAAKAAAVGSVLSIVTVGPLLLMLVAYTLLGSGPSDPADFALVLLRIVASGLAISAVWTSLSLAVSSLTPRKGIAMIAILIALVGSNIVSAVLYEAGTGIWIRAFALLAIPYDLVLRIFGEQPPAEDLAGREVTTGLVVAANVAWTLVFSFVVWFQYRRIRVTR